MSLEPIGPRFLTSDLDRGGQFFWIVRTDLGADAILQWRDDLSTRRVSSGLAENMSLTSSGNRTGYP